MRMKTARILILCLIGLLTNFTYATAETDATLVTSTATQSLFINVNGSGASITGQIYCSEDSEYTFTFGYNGSEDYEVVIGDTVLTPSNGSSFRQFTLTLKAGYTDCSITLTGTSYAYARLVIDAINGDTNAGTDGYIDLVAMN